MPENERIDVHRNIISSFFEELFAPFLFQSRNIEISYLYQVQEPCNDPFGEIAISSVNGCSTHEEFREKLSTLLTTSLQMVFDSLQQKDVTSRAPLLDYVRTKLQSLNSIVTSEPIILPDDTGNCSLHHHFKSFANCKLIGPESNHYRIYSQGIRFKTEKFALVWLQIIDDADKQIDLIQDMLDQSLKLVTHQPPQTTPIAKNYNPKFNLSVSQLGYFLHLLVKTGILDLLPRQLSRLIKWFSENIQSKNQETIQSASLRNKYVVHDPAALDYMEKKVNEMLAMIREDREKSSR